MREKVPGIIPHFAEGFEVDWTHVVPIGYRDFCMYIHPRIALLFRSVHDPKSNSMFYIGEFVERDSRLGEVDFKGRLNEIPDLLPSRLKKIFSQQLKSLFFMEDEVRVLAEEFHVTKFTAIVEVMFFFSRG